MMKQKGSKLDSEVGKQEIGKRTESRTKGKGTGNRNWKRGKRGP
jgi:hypothetical protein